MKLKVETWKSNKKNREDHYFTEKNEYVFEVNPKYAHLLPKILKLIKDKYVNK